MPGDQERSGATSAAVCGGLMRLLVKERCDGPTRARRWEEAPGGLPSLWPFIACRPAGGYAWLVARQVARAASCLEKKGRHYRALMGAWQCLYREGSGLAVD